MPKYILQVGPLQRGWIKGRVIPQIKAAKLYPLPIPKFDAKNTLHTEIVRDAKALASLIAASEHKAGASLDIVKRQISAINNRIEENVVEAYGLNVTAIKSLRDYLATSAGPRKTKRQLEMA